MERVLKVRLVRSCELRVSGKIYHSGDVMELDEQMVELLGDVVQRIEEPATPAPDEAAQAEPAPKKMRAKK